MLSISDEIKAALIDNAVNAKSDPSFDPQPLLKLFAPWGAATWLISEIDPANTRVAFGLADLGNGEPEIGIINLDDLEELEGPVGMRVEIDRYWKPRKSLKDYAEEAMSAGRIIP